MPGTHVRASLRVRPMNYTAALSDFFKTPRWPTNLLLGGVCFLIPVVGVIVLSGWHVTALWTRKYQGTQNIPDFDFAFFTKYLERAIYPFLVGLVASFMMIPIAWVFMALIAVGMMFTLNLAPANEDLRAAMFVVGFLVSFTLYGLLFVAITVLPLPLVIRATIMQDFGQSFDFSFYKRFVALTWKETLLASLFMFAVGAALAAVGMLACFIGVYFTMPLALFASQHLHKQLYDLYLVRGGDPLVPSRKLVDPPPLPLA
jgi:hypothetical protein